MRKYEGKLVGILGTVIIHLIAAIIFMSFKLYNLKIELPKDFEIEFAAFEEPEIEERLIDLPATSVENIFRDDEYMLNIARNLANRSDVKIDPAEYIDMVKEELIRSGMLGEDNYIDEQKRLSEMMEGEELIYENEDPESTKEEKPKESQEMAANYQGPTRIFYDLRGRTHTYLPIPIYKCEGSGQVTLQIEVNQRGAVESAQIIARESTTKDPCLIETAIGSAMISRFNPDINSPKTQKGTLTYLFVAQ
ncbi:MAG: hypothetical protein K0B05_09385 [Bacteroidales bacterium]|nr:hypothetical protein [Bacteroidales bacterium]